MTLWLHQPSLMVCSAGQQYLLWRQEENELADQEGQLCSGMLAEVVGDSRMVAKLSTLLENTSNPQAGHPDSTEQLLQ